MTRCCKSGAQASCWTTIQSYITGPVAVVCSPTGSVAVLSGLLLQTKPNKRLFSTSTVTLLLICNIKYAQYPVHRSVHYVWHSIAWVTAGTGLLHTTDQQRAVSILMTTLSLHQELAGS